MLLLPQRYIFSSKSQPLYIPLCGIRCCCCYHKGTYFQANHNLITKCYYFITVVVATTKVHIFKQITTNPSTSSSLNALLLLPQRYIFSSKSQHSVSMARIAKSCCCYHKGTYFQANHNHLLRQFPNSWLLLLPQRYIFSSKSQQALNRLVGYLRCCCYHKGTYFQANHNHRDWIIVMT